MNMYSVREGFLNSMPNTSCMFQEGNTLNTDLSETAYKQGYVLDPGSTLDIQSAPLCKKVIKNDHTVYSMPALSGLGLINCLLPFVEGLTNNDFFDIVQDNGVAQSRLNRNQFSNITSDYFTIGESLVNSEFAMLYRDDFLDHYARQSFIDSINCVNLYTSEYSPELNEDIRTCNLVAAGLLYKGPCDAITGVPLDTFLVDQTGPLNTDVFSWYCGEIGELLYMCSNRTLFQQVLTKLCDEQGYDYIVPNFLNPIFYSFTSHKSSQYIYIGALDNIIGDSLNHKYYSSSHPQYSKFLNVNGIHYAYRLLPEHQLYIYKQYE